MIRLELCIFSSCECRLFLLLSSDFFILISPDYLSACSVLTEGVGSGLGGCETLPINFS